MPLSPRHFGATEVTCSVAKADGLKLGLVHSRLAAKPTTLDDGKRALELGQLWLFRTRPADFMLLVLFESQLHLQVA